MTEPSKTGASFAALYAVAAIFLFHEAFTCRSMLCDLVAFPVFLPAGFVYWLPFSKWGPLTYVPDPMSEWKFVIPTVVTNVVFYYFLGRGLSAIFRRR